MANFSLFTAIGLVGAAVALIAYGLVTTGRVSTHSARYQWLNIGATAGILLSLVDQWNMPAFLANIAWLTIGVVSLLRMRWRA